MEQQTFVTKLIITFSLIFLLIYLYFKFALSYWKRKGFPYLEPSLFFGNIKPLLLGKICVGDLMELIHQNFKKRGLKYGGYYTFSRPILLVVDPELIKTIFVKEFSHFSDRGLYYDEKVDPLSCHLGAVNNPKWYRLRTILSSTFTTAKMKMIFPILAKCGEELVSAVGELSDANKAIDIKEIMSRYATDIIGSTAFGVDCNSLKNPDAEFRLAAKTYFTASLRNSIVFALAFFAPTLLKLFKIPINSPSSTKFFLDAIKETVEYREKNNVVRNDMLNVLIKVKNNEDAEVLNGCNKNLVEGGLSFNELTAHAFIFFIGGFESSSSIMSSTLYSLVKHEDVQDKVRKEIKEVLEQHGGELTYDALMKHTFLHSVLCETLRLYPVLPFLNRECTKEFVIPGTNQVIEKGTKLAVSLFGMQRDPDNFTNPDKFDPDRFSEGRKSEIKLGTYMPWGIGPRNCLAYRFGMLNIKVGLINLLKNFKFSADPDTKLPEGSDPCCVTFNFNGMLRLKATRI